MEDNNRLLYPVRYADGIVWHPGDVIEEYVTMDGIPAICVEVGGTVRRYSILALKKLRQSM